jgi:hypothetical protein
MRYFLDTEFYEDGTTIDLISIGIVAQDGREFYAVSREAQFHRVSRWVRDNVLPGLPRYVDPAWMSREDIMLGVDRFTTIPDDKPEFWAYYADYDWVALCQLFGTMMGLPSRFPKFCRDLKQLSCDVGSPKHPKDPVGEHNALIDARWNRDLYDFLMAHKSRTNSPPAGDDALRDAVNASCSCGGKGPLDAGVCGACLVWHRMKAHRTPSSG